MKTYQGELKTLDVRIRQLQNTASGKGIREHDIVLLMEKRNALLKKMSPLQRAAESGSGGGGGESKDDPMCAICLNSLRNGPVESLPCGHTFHKECNSDAKKLRQLPSGGNPVGGRKCPLCREKYGGKRRKRKTRRKIKRRKRKTRRKIKRRKRKTKRYYHRRK